MTRDEAGPTEAVDGREAYDVPFVAESSHGHMVALLTDHAGPGLLVDVGCGYAPHAEPLIDRGFRYVGVDADPAAVAALRERGLTAVVVDADEPAGLVAALDEAAEGVLADHDVEIAAVLALDVLEHLVSPHLTLAAIVSWMEERQVPLLGLSLPNASHQDVALKLLAGRFDLTPTGLLDHTHLRFFTDASFEALASTVGLSELARHDVRSPKSDQDWPERHPMLSDGALLGSFLRSTRRRGNEHATTFQFVRLYRPVPGAERAEPTLLADRPPSPTRSVTVVATGSAADLTELRADVEAQPDGLASLVVVDDGAVVRDVLAGVESSHVTFARPGDRLAPGWARSVLGVADRYAAATVRSGPWRDGDVAGDTAWPDAFSPFDHYVEDATPGVALAFPTAFLREASTEVGVDPADVDVHALVLEASTVCGVVDSGEGSVAARDGWRTPADVVDANVERLAGGALLAPVGAAREIARLRRAEIELVDLRAELEQLHAVVDGLDAELGRRPVRVVRRAADLVNRALRRG